MKFFKPKLIECLHGYDLQTFLSDLAAGVTVGIVALPLAIAFAIASGVTPSQGLWTAIVAGFLISALGGSRVQIGGPTGAFVIMGVAKFGGVIKFIPHPVITGFTSGIAVIIFTSQIKDFLGLRMGDVPADFVEKLAAYGAHLETFNGPAVGIALLALAVIVLWPRVSHRVP